MLCFPVQEVYLRLRDQMTTKTTSLNEDWLHTQENVKKKAVRLAPDTPRLLEDKKAFMNV